ncbi:TPA: hypothetical protein EYP66_09440 [Candidatus Poribacteria bacterium]|nr:hypothetical protein [Candidatus Poribacteria bacterium]
MSKILKSGAARSNITPLLGTSLAGYFNDRKAVDVLDDLHAKALVLDNGETKIALVVCDLIVLEGEYVNRARQIIESHCGIPPENVMISCTHTHTGPATAGLLGVDKEEEYLEFLVPRIADSVQMANRRLQDAQIGIGVGHEERLTFNRRYWMKDGTVRTNPGYKNPDIVRPAAPIDPDVGVMRVIGADSQTIALLTNFALHYVGGGPSDAVSADYFAFWADSIQRMHEEKFIAILANGCCGDINNVDVNNPPSRTGGYEHAKHVAAILAADVFSVSENLRFSPECRLAAVREKLNIPIRPITNEDVKKARQMLNGASEPLNRDQAYARELLFLAEMEPKIETEVQVIAINDLAIVALPGEMFVEIGLEIKRQSPFKYTFVVELANDYVGYVPTVKAFDEGGYETMFARSSKLAPEAATQFTESAVRLLGKFQK